MQRVAKVKALKNYFLLLQFQNGEKRMFDCHPLLKDRLYEQLNDTDFFRSVHVDNMGVVGWDEATDINPYVLYEKSEVITANFTPKGTKFEDIPSVKVLYITEYDALNNGQSVTHVSRCQKLNNDYVPVDDGEDIIFANTAVKKKDKYSKLLQLFLKKESFEDAEYPYLSKAIQHFKDTEKGRDEMCETIERYANEVAVDTMIKTCIKLNCSKEKIIKMVLEDFPQISEEQISKRVSELWDEQN